jgi:hypothetical protein
VLTGEGKGSPARRGSIDDGLDDRRHIGESIVTSNELGTCVSH